MKTLSLVALATAVAAVPASLEPRAGASRGPIVDLGSAGRYLGTVQNNGTVHSWKAIPYAAPPVGDLRFKPPQPLVKQNSTLVDVSQDFDGVPTACVQFGTTSYVGVNAGPGQEDCLKLWVWAPAGAKKGDKLAVQIYTHGGGYQNSQSPNNDFSDWVGQDKKFIAINANYRLGLLGFFNSQGVLNEGGMANAGLLDARLAIEWAVKHVEAFGGDPSNIAISGQSGGGGMTMNQLVLYDGKNPPFAKAIPRSVQRAPAWTVQDLIGRNDAFAKSVNCTDPSSTRAGAARQLRCLRALSAETIRLAALGFATTTDSNGFSWPGWLPSVDGKSISQQPTYLFRAGKFANVPILTGHVTNEFARLVGALPTNFTTLARSTIGSDVTPALVETLDRVYPAPIANYSYNTNTFQDAQHRGLALMDENGFKCAAPMIARAARKRSQTAYEFRFDANQPGVPEYLGSTHSSDNWYLQNATSTYAPNATMLAVAHEWRAYVASFIRHSDPNVEKLSTSVSWPQTSADGRYEPRMVLSYAQHSAPHLAEAPTNSGMELMDTAEWDRCAWWTEDEVVKITKQ
ncbi:Alpha/Beta hydrolase protein [Leucosporidium creatinivorum]|uniref:Carboxylic ester hydrolase n=1 Tax=Leucosporidium creatinivorum TaxID=106004 RepID=A0A1Y2G5H4_9BASI|nr:Alpha/Beta hydrolase protein [Leucosporidium creatinivorum]